jgi:hypothetical protein
MVLYFKHKTFAKAISVESKTTRGNAEFLFSIPVYGDHKLINGDKQVKFCMGYKQTYKLSVEIFLCVDIYKHNDCDKI